MKELRYSFDHVDDLFRGDSSRADVLLICTLMSWTTEEVLMVELTPHVFPAKVIHLC